MFAGFRSRWMIPCSCAASSASAICFAIGSASSSGIAPSRDPLRQVLALDQLHHESGHASALFEPVDARDVGMIQRRERFRFARESRQTVGVVRERVGQDLDRDVAVQLGVASAKDLPHAPFADRRDDFVDAEAGAGGEGQRWGLYGRRDSADGITPHQRPVTAARSLSHGEHQDLHRVRRDLRAAVRSWRGRTDRHVDIVARRIEPHRPARRLCLHRLDDGELVGRSS